VFGVFGFGEVVGDANGGPFAPFGLVDRRHGDLGVVFSAELRESGEDDVDAVFVDESTKG